MHSSRIFVARPFAVRRGRGFMRILGAAAGLVLLAAASTVVLVVAVGVGLVWGVRRLLVGASDGAAPREQRAHDPQTLEGEFRVVTPESLEQSTRER